MRSSAYPEAVAVSTSSSIPEGTVVGVATNMEIPSAPSLMSSSQTSLRYLNINHRNSSFYNSHVASTINMGATKRFLTSKGWSEGLQDFLIHNVATKLPYRFFICDDSGSMVTSDGKRLYNNTSGNNRGTPPKIVKCSRWAELVDALRFHVSLAEAMNLHSEFRLLNGSAQPVIVGGPESTPESSVVMNALLDGSPSGSTPLCRHIREVTETIRAIEPQLRESGQKAAIIIMTDGEASDGDLAAAMAPLRQLPVWVVVRLCTDDEKVVNYWNSIDEELEIEMDVLDDMLGESEEVHKANPWLTYSEPFHRMREFGVHMKELDLIDEQLLSADQVRVVCGMLFKIPPSEIPHPEAEFSGFLRMIQSANTSGPRVFNLHSMKQDSLVDVDKIRYLYSPTRDTCLLS